MEEYEEFNESDFELEEKEPEEKQEQNPFFRLAKGVVVILLILGLLHLFGFRNLFIYRTTPPAVEQGSVETKVDAQIFRVPLNVIVLTTLEEGYGSERDEESVLSLVSNAGRVWEQGGIELAIKNIHFEEKSNILLSKFYENPRLVINNIQSFDKESINVLLLANLGGINGISFNGLNTVAVADYTTVYDFRVLAHEVGHQLGLSHVDDSRSRLMYRGANGFNLSIDEVEIARGRAEAYEE